MGHAIVGCGTISGNHAYAARANGVDVLACCDRIQSKAIDLAVRYGIPTAVSSFDSILSDERIDSISICTDHSSHAELAIRALRSGKHVLVEKPIATESEDGLAMISEATTANRVLGVVSQHRYNPLVSRIRDLAQLGHFGTVALATGTMECSKQIGYYRDSPWRGKRIFEGGSTLINQFIHTLDLLVWILGSPSRVVARTRTLKFAGVIDTEDTMAAILEYPSGLVATLASTNASTVFWNSTIELIGDNGSVRFTTGHPIRILTLTSSATNAIEVSNELKRIERQLANSKPPTCSYYGVSHTQQFRDFIDACYGRKPLEMPPSEALRTLEVVLGIYHAAETNEQFEYKYLNSAITIHV